MNCIRNSILRHMRLRASVLSPACAMEGCGKNWLIQLICSSAATANTDQILNRVVGLVKKFDRINASKVTETADFRKDLSLDSLDKVELVMALEQEFSLEIPEEVVDKLTCCAEVARYIASGTKCTHIYLVDLQSYIEQIPDSFLFGLLDPLLVVF